MDVLVLGGGPAGATAAIYAARSGKAVTLVYQDSGALARAERIENFYGFPRPHFRAGSVPSGLGAGPEPGGDRKGGPNLSLGFGAHGLEAETTQGTLAAPAVVLATGAQRRRPRIPGLDDFDGAGVSYCAVCDGFFCRGKEVAVLGAGTYALHEAGVLLPLAKRVTLLTNGDPAPEEFPQDLDLDTRPIAALVGESGILSAVRFADGGALEVCRLFVALELPAAGTWPERWASSRRTERSWWTGPWPPTSPVFLPPGTAPAASPVATAVAQGAQAGLSAVRYLQNR